MCLNPAAPIFWKSCILVLVNLELKLIKEKAENISEQIKSVSEGDVVNARNEAEFAFWEAAKKAAELVKDSLEAKDAQVSKHSAHPEGELASGEYYN